MADFVDWTYDFVQQMVTADLLPGDLPAQLRVLFDQAVAASKSGRPDEACETAVLHPKWSELRSTANALLERFRDLGIPVPSIDSSSLGDISTVLLSEQLAKGHSCRSNAQVACGLPPAHGTRVG